jgi:hypothetical protein
VALEKLSAAFFKLLDELTIARSRKHIQKYYKDTIAQLGGFLGWFCGLLEKQLHQFLRH